MTKTLSASKKPRKQHTPEFRDEVLNLADRIGVAATARQLTLYESQLYTWRSIQQQQMTSYYNRWRRHSTYGGVSPEQFENQNLA